MSARAQLKLSNGLLKRVDRPVVIAFGCIVALLLVGSLYSRNFLSPEYLLQQLKVASFLGVIATGTMIVILLGQIDLSIPWVVAVGGMMSTAATGWGPVGEALAIPFGVACGIALGLVNGFGVAYLRIPSMIVTLAVNAVAQGLMVAHTGGFAPQDSSSPAMRALATARSGVRPAECAARLGRSSAPGPCSCSTARPSAARSTESGIASAPPICRGSTHKGSCSSHSRSPAVSPLSAESCSAGYASKAAQAMGDAYLLPAIASVVLGGASILGGRGGYLGTVAGVILITLLQSILSVIQMPDAGRQIIYGAVIVAMLLLYGRKAGRSDIRLIGVPTITRGNQSSMWLTMPSASLGSNQVDFGGMIAPASATAMRSLICVG